MCTLPCMLVMWPDSCVHNVFNWYMIIVASWQMFISLVICKVSSRLLVLTVCIVMTAYGLWPMFGRSCAVNRHNTAFLLIVFLILSKCSKCLFIHMWKNKRNLHVRKSDWSWLHVHCQQRLTYTYVYLEIHHVCSIVVHLMVVRP